MGEAPILGIPIIGDIWDGVTGFFSDIAGAAIDSVLGAITSWVIGGVLVLIELVWGVIDTTTRVRASAEWFSVTPDSPVALASTIGAAVTFITVMLAIVRAVVAGSPGLVVRTVAHDLPLAVFAAVATVGVSAALLDVADEMSEWVWAAGRDNTAQALENVSLIAMTGMPGSHFLGVLLVLGLLLSLLFVWIVLFVRQSLIYIVIVLALAFAWPVMIFPPLRDTAKKTCELLLALIIAKPVIALAMQVGISALGGVGATAPPAEVDCVGAGWAQCWAANAEQATSNLQIELGALVTGIVAFGLAAFMPFLIWKLMPLFAAAVIAQGVAGAPLRAASQAMSFQFYATSAMTRLGSGAAGAAARGGGSSAGAGSGGGGGGGASAGSGGSGATATPAAPGAAAPARLATGATP